MSVREILASEANLQRIPFFVVYVRQVRQFNNQKRQRTEGVCRHLLSNFNSVSGNFWTCRLHLEIYVIVRGHVSSTRASIDSTNQCFVRHGPDAIALSGRKRILLDTDSHSDNVRNHDHDLS